MKARRLRWHGAIRQQALANWLRLELGTWLEGWSVDSTLLSLRIADSSTTCPPEWQWTRADSQNGSAILGMDAAARKGLGGLLARASQDDKLGLGSRIGARALRALLVQCVGGNANLVEFQDAVAPTAEDIEPRFGGCLLILQGAGIEARLFVDNALFEYWVHPQRSTLPALSPRDAAIGGERVMLDVVLDLGSATLADAQQLQVGDVLVSNASIDSKFHLALPDARRLAVANLMRLDGKRALQIDVTPTKKVS